VDCHEGAEEPVCDVDAVPPRTDLTPAQSVQHMHSEGSPLEAGVDMVEGSGLCIDSGDGPRRSHLREDVRSVDSSADHVVGQQQMTHEVDMVKGGEGQLRSNADMGSSSNLVKRMKMRPRTRRSAAIYGPPYRHSYWRRYRMSPLHPYKRKPRAERKMETMKEDSVCASGASAAVVEANPAEGTPLNAATGPGGECSGVQWSLLGPIPTPSNTLSSSIMLAEEVMCACCRC